MIKGQYQVQVLRNGEPKFESRWFDNLILDRYFTNTSHQDPLYLCVGCGTTPPHPSDIVLEQELSSATVAVGTVNRERLDDGRYQYTSRFKASFDIGLVATDLTEFGMRFGNDGLISRALISDYGGKPTRIDVAADEQLVVNYWLKVVMSPVFDNQLISIFGRDVNVLLTTNNMLNGDFFSKTDNGGMLNPANSLNLEDARVYYEPQATAGNGYPMDFVGEFTSIYSIKSEARTELTNDVHFHALTAYVVSFTTSWDKPIYAISAYSHERFGSVLWQFNPPIPASMSRKTFNIGINLDLRR